MYDGAAISLGLSISVCYNSPIQIIFHHLALSREVHMSRLLLAAILSAYLLPTMAYAQVGARRGAALADRLGDQ